MKRKRILLYSHDTYGLGHLRRNLLLCERFCQFEEEPAVLIATGSPRTQAFDLPKRCDTLKLPAVTKASDGSYVSRTLPVSIEEVTRIRADLIVSAYRAFEPDLILVDHAPTGMRGELLPLFREIEREKQCRDLKVVLGLRDIIDDADRVREDWDRQDAWRWLDSLYDRILVYGDPRVRTTAQDLAFEEKYPGRVSHVGYLGRRELLEGKPRVSASDSRSTDQRPDADPTILVTAGGGGDGQCVMRAFIDYLESLPSRARFRSILVTGPFLSHSRYREIYERAEATPHPVEVFRFTNRLPYHLLNASGVISMAGYNSVTEILASRVPCLLIPRSRPRLEQELRVERLSKWAEIDSVAMDDLDARAIGAFIEHAVAKGRRCGAPRLDLDGLDRTGREIHRLLFGEAAPALEAQSGPEPVRVDTTRETRMSRVRSYSSRRLRSDRARERVTLREMIDALALRVGRFARRWADDPTRG